MQFFFGTEEEFHKIIKDSTDVVMHIFRVKISVN